MKFRTKLYLTFGLGWLVIAILGRIWFYSDAKHILEKEQRRKVQSIAAILAATISGDELSAFQKPEDANLPEFQKLADYLIRVRNANQRSDIDVNSIYFLQPSPRDPSQIEITIDVKNPSDSNTYFIRNEIWPTAQSNQIATHIKQSWATRKFYTDSWGTLLTGIAPIYDSHNKYVATVAVDLSAASIQIELNQLRFLAIISGISILIIGLLFATFLAHIATRSLSQIAAAVEEIGRGNLQVFLKITTKDEFGKLAAAITKMEKGLQENTRLKLNFIRYVSRHIMEKILTSDISITLKGERRKITVLFSDIRQFTTLAEKLQPEEVVSLLNEYLAQMLNVIFDQHGTVDKFLGDGLMVEFGAPLEDAEQEKHAVETALGMQVALEKLNKIWTKDRSLHLEMGIGIHTGLAVVGNIGSEKRMEYTAVGDTVNVASMLEQESKNQKKGILISETTVSAIKKHYSFRSLGPIKLPGRNSPLEVFIIEK